MSVKMLNIFILVSQTVQPGAQTEAELKMGAASLVVQWLRIPLARQGIQVQPLAGELSSHRPQGN